MKTGMKKRTAIVLLGALGACAMAGGWLCAERVSAGAQSAPVWTGDRNVYGGQLSSVTLPLALNGQEISSFTIEDKAVASDGYSISEEGVTLLPSVVEALGRGAYAASVQVAQGETFPFILYVGAERGEAVFFDFDLNSWGSEESFITSNQIVSEGIDGKSIAFEGSGGTLMGFHADGSYDFYPFQIKPRTRYRLSFDYQLGAKTGEGWNTPIWFGANNDIITLRADGSIGLPNPNRRDSAARMEYFEDGLLHADVTFVSPAENFGQIEFPNWGGNADLLIDNLLLMEYSEGALWESATQVDRISAEYRAFEREGQMQDGLTLRGGISNYDDAEVAEYGFLLCGPDGREYSYPCGRMSAGGEFALSVYGMPAGRYEARAYYKSVAGVRRQTAAAVVWVPAAEQEEEADVYIIAGQSNAHGCSPENTLTVKDAEKNNAVMYYNGQYHSDEARKHAEFRKVTTSFNVEESGGETLVRFGPEVGLSNMLCRLNGGKKIYIVKVAQGGSELYDRWASPSSGNTVSAGKSPLYRWFEETMATSAKYFSDLGIKVNLKAFLWMQGETDAVHRVHADAYERNLRIFLSDIGRTLGTIWQKDVSDMPFVIGGLHQDYDKMPYVDTVIEAQKKVASERDNYYFFDTTDLRAHDGWHYTGDAGFELGTRFAEAIALLEGYHTDVTFHAEDLTAQAENIVAFSSGQEGQSVLPDIVPEETEQPVLPDGTAEDRAEASASETPSVGSEETNTSAENGGGCSGMMATGAGSAALVLALAVTGIAIGKRRGGSSR